MTSHYSILLKKERKRRNEKKKKQTRSFLNLGGRELAR